MTGSSTSPVPTTNGGAIGEYGVCKTNFRKIIFQDRCIACNYKDFYYRKNIFFVGDCMDDKFSIASIGVRGTPVICGFNTGQHSKQIFFHLLFLKPGLNSAL